MEVLEGRRWRDRSRAKRNTVSTFRWWTVVPDGCESFKQIDGQVENLRRKCFYFAMMNCCRWSMCVLYANWWRGGEPKEKLLLLCDDELLLAPSFKQMSWVKRNFFAMMICCCKCDWWTSREPKQKLFLLCDVDLLLLMDLCPSRTFTKRSRTERDTVSRLWWSTVGVVRVRPLGKFGRCFMTKTGTVFVFSLYNLFIILDSVFIYQRL